MRSPITRLPSVELQSLSPGANPPRQLNLSEAGMQVKSLTLKRDGRGTVSWEVNGRDADGWVPHFFFHCTPLSEQQRSALQTKGGLKIPRAPTTG